MLSGMYIKLIAAAVIMAAVVGGYLYVTNLQDTVKELETQIVLKDAAIKQQNDAIDALKKEADARLAAAQAELEKAKAETVAAKARAQSAYKAKPSDPSNLCKSALDLVNGGAK